MSLRSKVLLPSQANSVIPLLIHGQGVFIFDCQWNTVNPIFTLQNSENQGFYVEFGQGYVRVVNLQTYEPLIDPTNTQGLINKHGAYYWLSLDSQNRRICAGIGEPRSETIIYTYTFPYVADGLFLESLQFIRILNGTPRKLYRDPITSSVPLLVKNTDELTLVDVAKGLYLPKANLSVIAQKLYDCIAGKRFVLDDEDFPEFSQAIEHSIRTPGCWCNRRLAEKSMEFSKDPQPLETYLRITLGENNGESPGVPYVMEIWPVGHYSPIHSHADANAIIRVLHGSIHVQLYPFLCDKKDGIQEFAAANFVKDDIAWVSPSLNQVHRLTNLGTNTETCITIQCYMYDEANSRHYDYFDYLDGDGNKMQYTPDSDMEFVAFRDLMKREWAQAKMLLGRRRYNPGV